MSIEGQGQSFTIYFPGFVCFVLYLDKISGERLQDHWSSGFTPNKNGRILKYRRLMKFSFYVNKYWPRRMSDFSFSRNPSKF